MESAIEGVEWQDGRDSGRGRLTRPLSLWFGCGGGFPVSISSPPSLPLAAFSRALSQMVFAGLENKRAR